MDAPTPSGSSDKVEIVNVYLTVTSDERKQARQKLANFMRNQAKATVGQEFDLEQLAPYVEQVEEADYLAARDNNEYFANINARLKHIEFQLHAVAAQVVAATKEANTNLVDALPQRSPGTTDAGLTNASTSSAPAGPNSSSTQSAAPRPTPTAARTAPFTGTSNQQTGPRMAGQFVASPQPAPTYYQYQYRPNGTTVATPSAIPVSSFATTNQARTTPIPMSGRITVTQKPPAVQQNGSRTSNGAPATPGPAPATNQTAMAEASFWKKLETLRNNYANTLAGLVKRVEDMQIENHAAMMTVQRKMLPNLPTAQLKPLQTQWNGYYNQRHQLKVLLDRMNVFQRLFSLTPENHKFERDVDLYLVDICELQFQHWLQQLQVQTNPNAGRPAGIPVTTPVSTHLSTAADAPTAIRSAVPNQANSATPIHSAQPTTNVANIPIAVASTASKTITNNLPAAAVATPAPTIGTIPAPSRLESASAPLGAASAVSKDAEIAGLRRQLDDQKQMIVTQQATISKLKAKKREWKRKYQEVESKSQIITTSIVSVSTSSTVSSSSSTQSVNNEAEPNVAWSGKLISVAVPEGIEMKAKFVHPHQNNDADTKNWPKVLTIKGVCESSEANKLIKKKARMDELITLSFSPADSETAVANFNKFFKMLLNCPHQVVLVDCIPEKTMFIGPCPSDPTQLYGHVIRQVLVKKRSREEQSSDAPKVKEEKTDDEDEQSSKAQRGDDQKRAKKRRISKKDESEPEKRHGVKDQDTPREH